MVLGVTDRSFDISLSAFDPAHPDVAGADAADAVAVRGVSVSVEVRDGAVEESESAEGDDLGLRVLIGKKQAVVSISDNGAGIATEDLPRAYRRLVQQTLG